MDKRQDRPYVFCHMMVSMDGKIMGKYMDTPEGTAAGEAFDRIAFGEHAAYRHQGWLSGRVTTDDNFTLYAKPALNESDPPVPAGDFTAPHEETLYYISIDPSGRLGWPANTALYGDIRAHVIEVLTGKASNAYKAFLRRMGISYIIAGEERLDLALVLRKLKDRFHMDTVMLGGGGILNWSFLQEGLCDEVSVVITAAADGSVKTQSLFDTKEGLTEDHPVRFTLKSAEVMDGGAVWLRYLVKKEEKK